MKRFIYVSCIIVALVATAGLFLLQSQKPEANTAKPAQVQTHSSVAKQPHIPPQPKMSLMPDVPTRLQISALNINVVVEQIGLTADNNMDAPKEPLIAGWYRGGYLPGSLGNSVIAGHSWHTKGKGVFADLAKLKPGDVIMLNTKYSVQEYRVTSTEQYPAELKATDAIFGPSDTANLNLITCTGKWNAEKKRYEDRLVVHTTFQKETEQKL